MVGSEPTARLPAKIPVGAGCNSGQPPDKQATFPQQGKVAFLFSPASARATVRLLGRNYKGIELMRWSPRHPGSNAGTLIHPLEWNRQKGQ
jgi:hypothetical protein